MGSTHVSVSSGPRSLGSRVLVVPLLSLSADRPFGLWVKYVYGGAPTSPRCYFVFSSLLYDTKLAAPIDVAGPLQRCCVVVVRELVLGVVVLV